MYVRWITQAGLVFRNERLTVIADPYLSNSVAKVMGKSRERRIPVDESVFDCSPDVILITHDHLDHLDPETLQRFFDSATKPITVLAPYNAYLKLEKFGGPHNYVMLNPHSVWSCEGVTFYAVKAEHSDRCAVGYIIDDGEKTFYISGDTLYNFDVIDEVLELCEEGVDYAFVPINGVGNNMNITDAADFVSEIGAKCAVPIHYGLFDSIDPLNFDYDEKIIFEPYEEKRL